MKIPFYRLRFSSAEKKHVVDVLKSGWVTTGPKVHQFEEQIKHLTGCKYAVAVSSCTAGLHLVLEASGIGPGDEVITTPFTMAATIEAIMYTGARPVLADIDPLTMNIDPESVQKKISRKTKAIVSVDIAGLPCDYSAMRKITHKNKLLLVSDAAHSLGATYNGLPIGTQADATVFSFYSTKNITTGEGGMVVTGKRKLAEHMKHLALHGMTSSGWKRYSGGRWKYDITSLGFKYNMPDLSAALGLGQLENFEKMQIKRARIASEYNKRLKKYADLIELPHGDWHAPHAWHLFIIRINMDCWSISRDKLIDELEKRGVGCGVHFIPIYRFSYFSKNLKHNLSDFPNCEKTFKRVISLPLYPDLTLKEVRYVCETLSALAERFCRQ